MKTGPSIATSRTPRADAIDASNDGQRYVRMRELARDLEIRLQSAAREFVPCQECKSVLCRTDGACALRSPVSSIAAATSEQPERERIASFISSCMERSAYPDFEWKDWAVIVRALRGQEKVAATVTSLPSASEDRIVECPECHIRFDADWRAKNAAYKARATVRSDDDPCRALCRECKTYGVCQGATRNTA